LPSFFRNKYIETPPDTEYTMPFTVFKLSKIIRNQTREVCETLKLKVKVFLRQLSF